LTPNVAASWACGKLWSRLSGGGGASGAVEFSETTRISLPTLSPLNGRLRSVQCLAALWLRGRHTCGATPLALQRMAVGMAWRGGRVVAVVPGRVAHGCECHGTLRVLGCVLLAWCPRILVILAAATRMRSRRASSHSRLREGALRHAPPCGTRRRIVVLRPTEFRSPCSSVGTPALFTSEAETVRRGEFGAWRKYLGAHFASVPLTSAYLRFVLSS